MNTKEQKDKVLKMLKEDVISQEQALDLLELISLEGQKESNHSVPVDEPIEFSSPKEPFDFFGSGHQSFSVSRSVETPVLESLRLAGKNSKVSIRTHNEDVIEINGWYKTVRNTDPMICFDNQNGKWLLNYNFNAVKYLGFDVKIPEKMVEKLYIENSNAEIDLTRIVANEMLIETKNAPIQFRQCQSKSIIGTTKNSHINIKQVNTERIELATTNARIDINELEAQEGTFSTSNAEIAIQNSQITKSYLQTKNATIWLDLARLELTSQRKKYTIEGRTTNANIELFLPDEMDLPFKINGSTKRGSIRTEGSSIIVLAEDKGYLNAKTENYDGADVSLDVSFQTTNGDIKLKNRYLS